MRTFSIFLVTIISSLNAVLLADNQDDQAKLETIKTDWGQIVGLEHRLAARVTAWPKQGFVELPTPFLNIVSAQSILGPEEPEYVSVEFNKDATQIRLLGTQNTPAGKPASFLLVTAEKSHQQQDGVIIFSALDADVQGEKAKLETHPGNHRIGFWTNADDYVTWNYTPTRPGTYDAELTYSKAAGEGTIVSLAVGETSVRATLKPTGSWYRYSTIPLGKIKMPKSADQTITVGCEKLTGGAAMNLKAITLRAACEGTPPVQSEDGVITCHARDCVIEGTKLQYEPQPQKNCVGYWVNKTDYCYWDVTVNQPGKFNVEITQGCGKGHGGSEISLIFLEHRKGAKAGTLEFKVKDTGHFNNFVVRVVGEITLDKPGKYQILVLPQTKAKLAVMDLRQVRLVPVRD